MSPVPRNTETFNEVAVKISLRTTTMLAVALRGKPLLSPHVRGACLLELGEQLVVGIKPCRPVYQASSEVPAR